MKSQYFPTPQYWNLSCERNCHPRGNLFHHVHYAPILPFKMTVAPEWSNSQEHANYSTGFSKAFATIANHDMPLIETKIPSLKQWESSPKGSAQY